MGIFEMSLLLHIPISFSFYKKPMQQITKNNSQNYLKTNNISKTRVVLFHHHPLPFYKAFVFGLDLIMLYDLLNKEIRTYIFKQDSSSLDSR